MTSVALIGVGFLILLVIALLFLLMPKGPVPHPEGPRRALVEEPFLPPLVNGPGDPGLTDPRSPYALLDLPTLAVTGAASGVNSRNCRAIDFSRTLERSNYGQMTNNYRHEYPDSCSAPFQETVLSLYEPKPLWL